MTLGKSVRFSTSHLCLISLRPGGFVALLSPDSYCDSPRFRPLNSLLIYVQLSLLFIVSMRV